jgi:Xaa-Pro aminopeptidase
MSHAPSATLSSRHRAIRRELAARGLDALVVTSLSNVLYLTNFTGSSAIVVITADRLYFVTDFRYVTALADSNGTAHECPGLELVTVDGSYDATLAALLTSQPAKRIGFEAAHLSVSRHAWLAAALEPLATDRSARLQPSERRSPKGSRYAEVQNALAHAGPAELVPTDNLVERLRVRKDDYEIATLREAARRLSQVTVGVLASVRRGSRERDFALEIDARIRQAGFERAAFETIVASGPNAALPHARSGERTITEGDLVVLDFGGVYDSYCVDLTRTVSVGRASGRTREVYDAVREAHDRAIAFVAPGRSRFEIDAAARNTLAGYGLGEAFGHGTGHGLGIDVHEDPRIARWRPDVETADEAVAAGMVFTIEPGAYVPGWGGVRIEDDVLVTEAGSEVLTDVTTELVEV